MSELVWDDYFTPIEYAAFIAEPGLAMEFGVATGKTLAIIAKYLPVVGFDSFEGLPEDWREGFPKGFFAGRVPDVYGAEIVVGWFEDSLPRWVEENRAVLDTLSLIHIDCDLYSSTVTILNNLGQYLKSGVIVVFDEYHGYPGWEQHEYKAWQEFVDATSVEYDIIGKGPEQLVVRIK